MRARDLHILDCLEVTVGQVPRGVAEYRVRHGREGVAVSVGIAQRVGVAVANGFAMPQTRRTAARSKERACL